MSDGERPAPAYSSNWGPRPPARRGLHLPPRRSSSPGVRRWWAFWLSPDDQPRWARPALLVVAALAALAYAWGLDHAALEPFYGAEARSMASSWHDFFFGSFDPNGTVTVDKLPGALWVQALSLRAFGVNTWAFVLPQVVEGILTVLVLYRAVRRLAGPSAGIVAALVMAASPVTVLLNRGNISDSLLILLLVLAADATSLALTTGRLRSLLLAGVWVGLAFQAKMTQAWLVLPALWLAYLVAAPLRGRVRIRHVAVATLVTAIVSLSWMAAVSVVPAHDRPYVDGSRDNSEFAQVFDYNGWARFQHPSDTSTSVGPLAAFFQVSLKNRALLNSSTATVGRSWHRLLNGPLGRDTAWLLPAALVSAIGLLPSRRRRPRGYPLRAACVLWGSGLVLLFIAFSDGAYLNSYYTAALSPAIAALCGVGASVAWQTVRAGHRGVPADLFETSARSPRWAPVLVAVAGSAGAVYAVFLLPSGLWLRPWLVPAVIAVAVAADVVLIASLLAPGLGVRLACVGMVVAALATLLVPSVASATVVSNGLGPFDTPFEPVSVTVVTQMDAHDSLDRAAHVVEEASDFDKTSHSRILFVTDTSAVAAPYILVSGREVVPIGGFTGANPSPTLTQIKADIASGQVRLAVIPVVPAGTDPRIAWLRNHCRQLAVDPTGRIRFGSYDCLHATAARRRLGTEASAPS